MIVNRIKYLCKQNGISIPKLEEELGFGRGSIYNWDSNSPSINKVQAVAARFNVSLDFIVGASYENKELSPINELIKKAHQTAIDKGWYEEPRTFGEMIALMHSELSEALEDYRNGRHIREIYYEGEKPCGIPIELADVLIRIFDICGYHRIDLEEALRLKMQYNATRPRRHGGKRI